MKIKEQTRKLAAGCSKHGLRWQIELTKSVTIIQQGEADVV
ncbi:hypothetical protein [Streptococcus pneumoniae]|nr:hypothetical protein [Streptococcus pneumoniae]